MSKKKIKLQEQLKTIRELEKHDHALLTPEGAKELAKPFGLEPRLIVATDTRSQFKGLTLCGKNPKTKKEYVEGDTSLGLEAHLLACQIADYLKITYPDYFGIGSQLRGACEAVEKYLLKQLKTA